jgi:hypothetical protein
MQVLAALGVLCFTQGSGLQSKHTAGQVSGMTTATQSYTQTGVGVSSAMMESEMNKIAADVENMEKESSVIESQVANELQEST